MPEQTPLVKNSIEQGVLVLTLTSPRVQGEETAEALRQELTAALEQSGIYQVVVDFRNARFLSSAAFRPLLLLRRKLQEQGGRLLLCNLSRTVADVFRTTRLISDSGDVTAMFEMEPDLPAALARLNAPAAQQPS